MSQLKFKVDIKDFEHPDMYKRFIKEPSPSVCVTGNFNITKIMKQKRKGHSLNALLCFCVLQAAQKVKEFHYSIKEDGLYYYTNVKTNGVINGKDNQLYFVDYKYFQSFKDFEIEYKRANKYCYENCVNLQEDSGALIGTSAVPGFPFTSVSLDISPTFWDNFLVWGKYQKRFFKTTLDISLRFHHATIDGQHAAMFFNELQKQFNTINV
ncbi:MAG: hypothetical protein E7378_04200 [Clostridiales bacterium]|nr:hypothetical protein [Clostridiales bacterium]